MSLALLFAYLAYAEGYEGKSLLYLTLFTLLTLEYIAEIVSLKNR